MPAHWLFATVLLLGLAVRAAANWAYRPIFIYPDSTYYLIWAKLWRPGDARPVGYSIFARGLLELQGVGLIAIVQSGLGLLLGVLIYVFLIRWGCRRWAEASATIPVLLDPLESLLEHYLLSDVLANVLIVGALVAIGWSRRFEWQAAAIAGLTIGCATVVRSGSALCCDSPWTIHPSNTHALGAAARSGSGLLPHILHSGVGLHGLDAS